MHDNPTSHRTRWSDLSATTRGVLVTVAAVDGLARVAALVDLVRRPAEQVRGNKAGWAAALALVNSAGVLPAVYFLRGRRR